MSDKPETLAAMTHIPHETVEEVLAEMKRGLHYGHALDIDDVNRYIRDWAIRIEAAAERETDAAIREALANVTDYATGNVAAMREALVEIIERTNREKERDYDAALNGGILEIHDIANTALNETKGE